LGFTATAHVSVFPPSVVVTLIVAVPTDTGVTTPPLTVAIASSLLDQVTLLFVALLGSIIAFKVPAVPPATKLKVGWSNTTAVTAISDPPC